MALEDKTLECYGMWIIIHIYCGASRSSSHLRDIPTSLSAVPIAASRAGPNSKAFASFPERCILRCVLSAVLIPWCPSGPEVTGRCTCSDCFSEQKSVR